MRQTEQLRHMVTALWNYYVPRRAVVVQDRATHVRWLHPTKGWRRVSKKRLGLA